MIPSVNPILLRRHPQATVATASVGAASNFFATNITFTSATNDMPHGMAGFLFVSYASVTTAILELVVDDGSASLVMSMAHLQGQTTYVSTGLYYNYIVAVNPNFAYNFSPALGGTAVLCDIYFVPGK